MLSGEGIRFDEFEMNFRNKKNLMTIDEIYAIGPAISILMDGYVEKNKLVSLRGTLVPATTLNKMIGSIPLLGDILQPYKKGSNDGIDISATSGTPIRAAAVGVVVAITVDTEQRSILIMRHQGNLLTIYANISGIKVKKGEQVKAGDIIAKVSDSKPSFLHFEVREGLESVDPAKYF